MERKQRSPQDESEKLAANYTNGHKLTDFRGADQKSGTVLPVSMEGFYEDIDPAIFDELIRKGDLPRLHLKESGGHSLLTKEEEHTLAWAWRDARSLKDLLPNVDESEKERYTEIIRHGELARQKLVDHNVKLVADITRRYIGQGVEYADLMQGGYLGLLRAIDKFKPELGNKFSTYATYWIHRGASREIIERGRAIRLPAHLCVSLRKMKKEYNDYAQEIQREPNAHEFAEYVGMSREEVDEILAFGAPIRSIHEPLGVDSETTLENVIADPNSGIDSLELQTELRRKRLQEAFQILNKREVDILGWRFGLKDGKRLTLDEVGEIYNLTRERIRQIEKEALRKLRSDSRFSSLLRGLLD